VSHLLGVDGGGTKTAFVLVDDSGVILARAEQPSAYYHEYGREQVAEVLAAGTAAVCGDAGIGPDGIAFAYFALPGYGEISRDVAFLDEAPAAVLRHRRYQSGNDMVAGWAGSLGGADGINVIGGTGSMTYGERKGRSKRVGGWGELFGDEGSGHWIGLRALNAFTRMSDGRTPRGPLHRLLRERASVASDLDIIDVVFTRWRKARSEIAALAPLVVRAADEGDAVAERILAGAAAELADLVEATRANLGFGAGETVPVSYSGGLFSVTRVRDGFAAALRVHSPNYDLRAPLLSPAAGAALYAAKLAGSPFSAVAIERLRHAERLTGVLAANHPSRTARSGHLA
jgi:N-acetylglucosamine kinase-like BadF-type ATPase